MSVLDLFDLHGKRALITGASTGIGKRVALAYVEAGAQVAIAARHLDALEKLADEIGTSGGKVVPVCCDVSQHQQVTSMLDQVTAELGGIDIAVCNAGIITVTPMLDMPLEEFQRLQNTNVTGVFLTAQAAAGQTRPRRGHHQHCFHVRPHHQRPAAGFPLLRLQGGGHSSNQSHGRGVGAA
ncbi:probable short-chain type dehydrogenase [Mycobacterium tuberculosis]|nr:short-chain type dehydrogenase/reductase [Mycobacterium tuberculosis]KAL71939.1 oxidoreductase [Mycobacterium tuberculosis MD20344]KAN12645.1 oxidoreductase [Mycobacterium tuberculosis 2229BH]KAN16704.1 oxidoreductase [Mycobacterium tuberculosis 2228BH]KAN36402.1 oxidoreductase [Mycobacterium tuberculosis 2091HD]KAN62238.1 oxidoreductase [Mycobacterium tuberculosis 1430BH]KAN65291.1 oxidoreductase [Mycobacterium tuberculosis 1429BH]KAO11017.1 oxidoreductase [Mycobacterium tuberculosis MD1